MLRRYDADVPPTAVDETPSMLECTFNAFVSARLLDGGTHGHRVSAAINNRVVSNAPRGPYGIIQPAGGVEQPDSAAAG